MTAFLTSLWIFAADSGTGRSGGGTSSSEGDSSLLFILIIAAVVLVATVLAALFLRARGTDQSSSERPARGPEPVGEGSGADGRPLHIDPDPDGLAGGRGAQMSKPEGA